MCDMSRTLRYCLLLTLLQNVLAKEAIFIVPGYSVLFARWRRALNDVPVSTLGRHYCAHMAQIPAKTWRQVRVSNKLFVYKS